MNKIVDADINNFVTFYKFKVILMPITGPLGRISYAMDITYTGYLTRKIQVKIRGINIKIADINIRM